MSLRSVSQVTLLSSESYEQDKIEFWNKLFKALLCIR